MYLDYWGLQKHPFNSVPDPGMYFDAHQSVDDAVSEVMFAIEEGDECLAVVVGPVGVGKTMCLRIVLDALSHDKYSIAFVTNPDMTFAALLREIIGQLEGKTCQEYRKDKLFEMFNRILFETSDKGKHVVIFIDEGNVIKPHNLESLRLLTNMQDDTRNLLTIVLAGQMELARRLEAPCRANLFQRIGVYCKISGIDSVATMKDYIEHRLERAGLPPGRTVFTPAAYETVWAASDKGMPRMINKICKLCLKAGETNSLKDIDAPMVKAVAERFLRTYTKQHAKAVEEQKKQLLVLEAQECLEEIAPVPKPPPRKKKMAPPAPPPAETSPATPAPEPPPPVSSTVRRKPRLSREELENLASKLATERVKKLTDVADPFDAWEKARADILKHLAERTEPL